MRYFKDVLKMAERIPSKIGFIHQQVLSSPLNIHCTKTPDLPTVGGGGGFGYFFIKTTIKRT